MPNSGNKSEIGRQAPPMRGPGGHRGGARFSGEKPKDFRGALSKLFRYCRRYVPIIAAAMIFAALGSTLNVIGPKYLKEITNLTLSGMASGIDIEAVVKTAVFLSVIYGLGFFFNITQGIMLSDISQKTVNRLRTDISSKINRLPLSFFDRHAVGDVMSRISNDADTIGQSMTQSLSSAVASVTLFVGVLFMMFYTNAIMAVSGIVSTLFGFGLMVLIIKKSQKYFSIQQSELGKLNGHIEEHYNGHNVVTAYNGTADAKRDFDEINGTLYYSAWRSQFMSGLMMPLIGFIGNLGYVVVCIVGALLAVKGKTDFGTIVAFMTYIRLFTQPLTQLAMVATSLQSAAAASERVFGFLSEEEMSSEDDKSASLDDVRGDIDFENVCFGYDEEKTIIHNFSAKAKAGQKIAIVGPTGAGKTTMVNLLMRFYELWSGSISVDGVPLSSLKRENVHRLFGMVLQDTWLFEGTIRENIIYNKKDVTEQQLKDICKATGLYHFIRTLPKGLETVLDDNTSISAGQKQLVTIARAMVENAPLLILDEATSSVDTRTEEQIQRAMDRLTEGRTSFVIAHRLSTIRNAALILVMKDGDIVESGNHDELMAKGGFYAELYNSQFEAA